MIDACHDSIGSMKESMSFKAPTQEASNDEIIPVKGELTELDTTESFYGEASNDSAFETPAPVVEDTETVSRIEPGQSEDDFVYGVVGEQPDLPASPKEEEVGWSDEIVGESPAYPDQFSMLADAPGSLEQSGQIDGAPDVLQREILDMEHAVKIGEINASIASIRNQIEQVNRAVQLNRIGTEEGDRKYQELHDELIRLENIKRGPTPSEQASLEPAKSEAAPLVNAEKTEANPEKTEYLRLKKEYKSSEREYLATLKQDYGERGLGSKIMGLGRGSMSPDLQAAYDKFMTANKAYYQFAESSGAYSQIAERLNKNRQEDEKTTLHAAVAGRHVLRPAEERLKIQTLQMPKWMVNVKNEVSEKIKAHPKVAMAVGGAVLIKSAIFSMPALLAGIGTRMIGGKISDSLDSNRLGKKYSIMAKMGTEVDLEALESQYFDQLNLVQKVRTGTKWASVGAGIAAGGISAATYSGEGVDVVGPGTEVAPDSAAVEAVENVAGAELSIQDERVSVEAFVPKSGDNLSTALFDAFRQQVEAGKIQLPPGVTEQNLAAHMYKIFPEMTDATGSSPHLSSDEWIKLGVLSGDPHNIQVGEPINMQALLDKMASAPDNIEISAPEASMADLSTGGEPPAGPPVPEQPVVGADENTQDQPATQKVEGETIRVSAETPPEQPSTPEQPVVAAQEQTAAPEVAQKPPPVFHEAPPSYNGNQAEQITQRELLAARYRMSPHAWNMYELQYGYKPQITTELFRHNAVIEAGTTAKDFSESLYRHMFEAFRRAEINLPAQTTEYVIHNPTAINAFVDRNASEFATEFNPFLSGKQPLDLSADQWKELGFSSGNPRELVPGDKIEMGKLIKLILENAAERANERLRA